MTMTSPHQDAVALLTLAMHAQDEELDALIAEFTADGGGEALLRAVVGLCRSLCLATSGMIKVIEDDLTNQQAFDLTTDELLPMAMEVVRRYATAAARGAGDADAETAAADQGA